VGQLGAFADLERLAGRAAARRATPDDLRALAGAAAALPGLAGTVAGARDPFLRALGRPRPGLAAFAVRAAAVLPDPGQPAAPGEAAPGPAAPVRPDASPALAAARGRLERAGAWQTRYVEGLRRLPALTRLKLERTSTQGLFLEVPANTAVPGDWIRRGGLQRVERYSTAALEAHAVELAAAEGLVAAETRAVLDALRAAAAGVAGEARDLSRDLAATDALLSLALVAAERGWVRPEVDEAGETVIEAGRHPVVEGQPGHGPFQPNDARLQARGLRDQVVVLTGPNMAGKSVWMRQVALLTLLAQVGSFVPAARARIGLADAIYTRIGAVDDPAGGRSTFMVEMEETATVLRGATDRSLVLLDELGRGTSTHDGMAIAWAVIEHLAAGPVRPRAIVATHYHELAALGPAYPQLTLLRAAVEELPDRVVFTHRIEPGAADRSFGVEVARLAGLPPPVLARAREVAAAIEPLSAEIAGRLGGLGRPGRGPARARREIA
jgi:DNA mismatch repair protein MutS